MPRSAAAQRAVGRSVAALPLRRTSSGPGEPLRPTATRLGCRISRRRSTELQRGRVTRREAHGVAPREPRRRRRRHVAAGGSDNDRRRPRTYATATMESDSAGVAAALLRMQERGGADRASADASSSSAGGALRTGTRALASRRERARRARRPSSRVPVDGDRSGALLLARSGNRCRWRADPVPEPGLDARFRRALKEKAVTHQRLDQQAAPHHAQVLPAPVARCRTRRGGGSRAGTHRPRRGPSGAVQGRVIAHQELHTTRGAGVAVVDGVALARERCSRQTPRRDS
jgi:hypothetical protein